MSINVNSNSFRDSLKSFAGNTLATATLIESMRLATKIVKMSITIDRAEPQKLKSNATLKILSFVIQTIVLAIVEPLIFKATQKTLGANREAMVVGQISSQFVSDSKSTLLGSLVAGIFAFFNSFFTYKKKCNSSINFERFFMTNTIPSARPRWTSYPKNFCINAGCIFSVFLISNLVKNHFNFLSKYIYSKFSNSNPENNYTYSFVSNIFIANCSLEAASLFLGKMNFLKPNASALKYGKNIKEWFDLFFPKNSTISLNNYKSEIIISGFVGCLGAYNDS